MGHASYHSFCVMTRKHVAGMPSNPCMAFVLLKITGRAAQVKVDLLNTIPDNAIRLRIEMIATFADCRQVFPFTVICIGITIRAKLPEDLIDIIVGCFIRNEVLVSTCLLYTSPSPRDQRGSRMPSSA